MGRWGSRVRAFRLVSVSMGAAVVHKTGAAEKLTVEEAWPVPTLADGQVRRGGSERRVPQAELTAPVQHTGTRARIDSSGYTPSGSD
eukprot:SAG25_NODE_14188_length_258_cov_0.628931_1_plen_86_part_11